MVTIHRSRLDVRSGRAFDCGSNYDDYAVKAVDGDGAQHQQRGDGRRRPRGRGVAEDRVPGGQPGTARPTRGPPTRARGHRPARLPAQRRRPHARHPAHPPDRPGGGRAPPLRTGGPRLQPRARRSRAGLRDRARVAAGHVLRAHPRGRPGAAAPGCRRGGPRGAQPPGRRQRERLRRHPGGEQRGPGPRHPAAGRRGHLPVRAGPARHRAPARAGPRDRRPRGRAGRVGRRPGAPAGLVGSAGGGRPARARGAAGGLVPALGLRGWAEAGRPAPRSPPCSAPTTPRRSG